MKLVRLYWYLHAKPVTGLLRLASYLPKFKNERQIVYTATWFLLGLVLGLLIGMWLG
jgi:hypothetical protein